MEQDKPSQQPDQTREIRVIKKSIKIQDILRTCREAVQDFDLERLLVDAKTKGFLNLSEDNKERFCAGMIVLGETLTFCRHPSLNEKRWEIEQAKIDKCASDYASVRNYFVHHAMYGCPKQHEAFAQTISTMDSIERLTQKLSDLEDAFKTANEGIPEEYRKETLSKIVARGKNSFLFEYMHIFECLKIEFAHLNKAFEQMKRDGDLSDSTRIALGNRVRNIMTIMLDLSNEQNKNLGMKCTNLKIAAKKFNVSFFTEYSEFEDFFMFLEDNRNSLCHIHDSFNKPYRDDVGFIDFLKNFQELFEKKYLEGMQEALLNEAKDEKHEEAVKVSKPIATGLEVSPKKAKQDGSGSERKSSALDMLSVYNTNETGVFPEKSEAGETRYSDVERERKCSPSRSVMKK